MHEPECVEYHANELFNHYPYFIFAVKENGEAELWIGSAHTLDPDDPESEGSRITREHMHACRRSYETRWQYTWDRGMQPNQPERVTVVVVPREEVTFV